MIIYVIVSLVDWFSHFWPTDLEFGDSETPNGPPLTCPPFSHCMAGTSPAARTHRSSWWKPQHPPLGLGCFTCHQRVSLRIRGEPFRRWELVRKFEVPVFRSSSGTARGDAPFTSSPVGGQPCDVFGRADGEDIFPEILETSESYPPLKCSGSTNTPTHLPSLQPNQDSPTTDPPWSGHAVASGVAIGNSTLQRFHVFSHAICIQLWWRRHRALVGRVSNARWTVVSLPSSKRYDYHCVIGDGPWWYHYKLYG